MAPCPSVLALSWPSANPLNPWVESVYRSFCLFPYFSIGSAGREPTPRSEDTRR